MIAVVVSRADHASEHIGEHLLDLAEWTEREDASRPDGEGGGGYYRTDGVELREFDALHLDVEDAAAAFDDPDLLLFASRHSGETGPLLTGHFTGNFGHAEYGGTEGDLARACPNAQARLLSAFDEHAPEGYEVGMECTHHGPSRVGVPSMFVELGSGEEEWSDPDGARAVARAILDLRGVAPHRERQLVGFGGGHYVPRFERVVRETDWAVGHVAADWCLESLGDPAKRRDTVRQAFERSDADHALVEGDHPGLTAVVEDLGYRVVSETWVRETTGVPLDLAGDLEAALTHVDDGLRFGDLADERRSFSVVDLPAELLDDASGVDHERAREAVAGHALAYETTDGGSRVAGRAAVRDRDDYDRIVDELAAVVAEKYDAVERADGAVVAHETAFDPAKARKLGVPEGPAFGKLSNGQAVEVDGETIVPEAVHSERTHRFPV
ncbi:D-aminoacyl-tRNA deacylase [Halomicrococcus gelatinilyticus]|uniref:D-aminoacyl-tRNA deacylase n=1 Tax=Halomicrococcus gelatinilyticus TaxID=1702103 RepID=UPI002E12778B